MNNGSHDQTEWMGDPAVSDLLSDQGNFTNFSQVVDCPQFSESSQQLVAQFSFWIEGVTQTIVAILGIFGNIVAGFILSRREMRNAFNLLLVTLACFDSTYLFGSILESFRKEFKLVTDVHIILFPYLLWPFTQIVFTCSIFMTVAIAVERFIAVHYPINYSQAMHEANALTKRIVKYVSAVTFLSLIFTITRFFEAKVVYEEEMDPLTNVTYQVPVLHPTELRTAPLYTAYFNWSRLIVLGIIPFVLLVYLNTMIYKDIKARRVRRMAARNRPTPANAPVNTVVTTVTTNGHGNSAMPEANANGNTTKNGNTDKPEENGDVELQPLKENEDAIQRPKEAKPPAPPSTVSVNESRYKKEDNMAVIFMGFILVFLICHSPRLFLNIHELATIRHAMECQDAGQNPFPLWSQIAISLSHVLLAVNSSTNIFIYCFLSSKFREECKKLYDSICRKLCVTQI